MTPKSAILYLRLSQADDASTSIQRQEKELQEYATREGWTVTRVLTDDGISGRKSRANAHEALRMLRAREADALLVWKFDRWSRQGLGAVADLVETLDAVPESVFVALRDGLNSTQPSWRIIASVLAEVARMEAENTSTRVRSSIQTLKHSGRFPGGAVPFGYAVAPAPDGPGKVLVVDRVEAAVILDIAARVLAGESLTRLIRDLNARKIPTARSATRIAARAGKPVRGLDTGLWRISTIRVLMVSDHLLGRVVHKGALVTDAHGLPERVWEPILDLQTLTRLRKSLGDPRAKSDKPRRVRAARLLSGVAFCAHCGGKLYVKRSGGRDLFGCSQQRSGSTCPAPRIVASTLEEYVAERFLSAVGDWPEVEEVEEVTDPGSSEALAEVEDALHETTAGLMEDSADVGALLARMEILKARRAALRMITATVETRLRPTGFSWREAWEAASDVEGRRRVLLLAIDHVRVGMRRSRGPQFEPERVEIIWNVLSDAGNAD